MLNPHEVCIVGTFGNLGTSIDFAVGSFAQQRPDSLNNCTCLCRNWTISDSSNNLKNVCSQNAFLVRHDQTNDSAFFFVASYNSLFTLETLIWVKNNNLVYCVVFSISHVMSLLDVTETAASALAIGVPNLRTVGSIGFNLLDIP